MLTPNDRHCIVQAKRPKATPPSLASWYVLKLDRMCSTRWRYCCTWFILVQAVLSCSSCVPKVAISVPRCPQIVQAWHRARPSRWRYTYRPNPAEAAAGDLAFSVTWRWAQPVAPPGNRKSWTKWWSLENHPKPSPQRLGIEDLKISEGWESKHVLCTHTDRP